MADDGIDIPIHTPGAAPAAASLERVATALDRTARASRASGDASRDSTDHWAKLSNAFNETYAAANTVLGVVVRLTTGTAALAAEQAHLDDMSTRLGLNFDEAAGAAGRFTDEVDVMNTAGAFAARGIHLTQTELNAMTRAAARNAQQTGVETSQALTTLTEALIRGRERGLAPFGEGLGLAARNGYTLTEGLTALVAQEGRMDSATDDARTSMQGLSDGIGDVLRGTATWTSNLIGLPSIIGDVSRAVSGLAGDIAEVNRLENEAQAHTAEGGARARALAEFARAQHRSGELADSLGAPRSSIATANVNNMTTEQIVALTQRATAVNARLGATQGAGVADIADRARDALRPASGSTFAIDTRAGGVDPFLASVTHTEQEIRRASRDTTISVERDREELVAVYREAGRELDASRAAELARAMAAAAAERAARRRAGERDEGGGGGAADNSAQELAEARRASSIALEEKLAREARESAANDDANARGKGAEQRRLDKQEADRAEAEARATDANTAGKGAEQSRLNRLADERSFNGEMRSLYAERASLAHTAAEAMKASFDGVGEALSTNIQLFVDGRASLSEALQGVAADSLKAISKQAYGKGAYYAAEALGMLAIGNFPGAGLAAASSAAFFAAGALTGAAGAAIAPTPTAATGGSGARAASVSPQRSTGAAEGSAATVVNNYYAPVIGGRTATEGESGMQVNRLTAAERRRTDRAA